MQEADAFATLEEDAGLELAPYFELVLQNLVVAFDKYQHNMSILSARSTHLRAQQHHPPVAAQVPSLPAEPQHGGAGQVLPRSRARAALRPHAVRARRGAEAAHQGEQPKPAAAAHRAPQVPLGVLATVWFKYWVHPLIERLIPILLHPKTRSWHKNAAVSVGRVGLTHPDIVPPHLPEFLWA